VNDVTIFKSYVTIVFVTDFNFVTPENHLIALTICLLPVDPLFFKILNITS